MCGRPRTTVCASKAATGEPITPPLRHGDCVWSAAFSPDGRQVLTTSGDGTARVWELPLEKRPLAELVQMAQVLTGLEMREPGQLVPLNPDRFGSDWAALHARYPREFPCRRAEQTPNAAQKLRSDVMARAHATTCTSSNFIPTRSGGVGGPAAASHTNTATVSYRTVLTDDLVTFCRRRV
jgi:hypothetical protein